MSHIKTETEAGVLTISLDRADKKNAITQAMYAELAEAVRGAQGDPAVRVILFRAEGDSFSAGTTSATSPRSPWAASGPATWRCSIS